MSKALKRELRYFAQFAVFCRYGDRQAIRSSTYCFCGRTGSITGDLSSTSNGLSRPNSLFKITMLTRLESLVLNATLRGIWVGGASQEPSEPRTPISIAPSAASVGKASVSTSCGATEIIGL